MKNKFIILFILFIGSNSFAQKTAKFSSSDYVVAMKKVTDVMVADVTSPVAAARYYGYVTLASNEVSALFNKSEHSFSNTIRLYEKLNVSDTLIENSDASFATVFTVYKMAEKLLPSGYKFNAESDSITAIAIKKGLTKKEIENTIQLVNRAVLQTMQYVKADGFSLLNSYKKYTPLLGDGYWQPTGPAYMAAIEPNWQRIRTFFIESPDQFKPEPPAPFNMDKASSFYKQLLEVYTIVNKLNKKERAIASFWDCNPFFLQQIGHVEFGLKKISPGGHWMGITGIACLKKQTSLQKTAFVHASVALAMSDAFVSCWDEKYRSNRIRPETAIKKYIDRRWNSLLQTPPFPEYTSGHSVISTTAATILTQFFGDKFSYVDSSEIEFGLPERKYKSFFQASQEAAISRLYGGIHYRDAVEFGVIQGKSIGLFINKKIIKI